jgi:hypothetical protein
MLRVWANGYASGMIRFLAPAAVLLLALTGCSSAAQPSPTPTEPAGPATYSSVVELKDAYVAAGGDCDEWAQTNRVTVAAQSGDCDGNTVLSTYASESDRETAVANLKMLNPDNYSLLSGPNWIINSPDVADVSDALGGVLVTK